MNNRILVVDDNPDVADSLVRLLQALNYEARAIYDGKQAEAVAIDYLPDLAFIDIAMPGFDGYQTVSQVRAIANAFMLSSWRSLAITRRNLN